MTARLAASLYAAVAAMRASEATASVWCTVPVACTPGGKPVIDVPGETPRSPEITVGPVLVTVEEARTAKLSATPRSMLCAAPDGVAPAVIRASPAITATMGRSAIAVGRGTMRSLPQIWARTSRRVFARSQACN